MRVLNAYRKDSHNVGDQVCAPHLYFPGLHAEPITFRDASDALCDVLIVGGGVKAQAPPNKAKTVIGWGIGASAGKCGLATIDPSYQFAGVRDYRLAANSKNAQWVPCVSCMSPLFDRKRAIERDLLIYFNSDIAVPKGTVEACIKAGLPFHSNRIPFESAVDFLASARVVVTNSYHGAYWATLLGRAVVIVDAYSSKFYDFPWPLRVVEKGEDWQQVARETLKDYKDQRETRICPDALDLCRTETLRFCNRIIRMLFRMAC